MTGSHTCVVNPDSIEMISYMKQRKICIFEGNCKFCGLEMLRALALVHWTDDYCGEGCCRKYHDSGLADEGTEGCIPDGPTVGPHYGDQHNMYWKCVNCDCDGLVGEGNGKVYEESNEESIEFWSGDIFKSQTLH